jgi:hypothetical protein
MYATQHLESFVWYFVAIEQCRDRPDREFVEKYKNCQEIMKTTYKKKKKKKKTSLNSIAITKKKKKN